MNKKKLIEVALPLDAINKASAREKSIRHGHPSTLHLWWARRPLAAARAVIFAQMVDDPSAHPDLFPTEKAQEKERQRLFRIIEDLVLWENTTNEKVLQQAGDEVWQSWRYACAANAGHPRAKELFDRHKLPAFHDPFAGGGSIPLEAQRLGLEAYASDLNPVAVLINKAMIEIPPTFAGKPPVNPDARRDRQLFKKSWKGAEGLAEDVRYYGQWMRDEAEKRIGHLYPKIGITAEMAKERPDLKPLVGQKLTVIAWLWARTVKSPNPAFAHVDVPLASTFMLSTKPGQEAYVEPKTEWAFTGVVAVALPRSSREHGHHWTTIGVSGYGPWLISTSRRPDPLLSSWMSSSPAYILQNFPVLADLASEHTAGPSLTQTPGNSNGGSVPANHAPTAASKYSNTDRPCCVQVAITVQIRSHQRFPFSLLVPCVISRSITTNRIACSARLLVGSTPGVVMNRK